MPNFKCRKALIDKSCPPFENYRKTVKIEPK